MTRGTRPTSRRARGAVALAAAAIVVAVMDGAFGSGALVDSLFTLLVAAALGYLLGAWTTVPVAATGVLLTGAALTFANQRHFPDEYPMVDDLTFFLLVLGAPAVAGASLVARAGQVRELTELSERLGAQRASELSAARLEEQQRIELAVHHRIVEQMGAIALRADGARRQGDTAARDRALEEVETMARAGLDNLREALGLLRVEVEVEVEARPAPEVVDRGRRAVEPPCGWRDLALALGLAIAMGVESVVSDASRGPAPANVLASFVVAAPVVARRHHPVVASAATLLLAAAMSARLTPSPEMVTAIALLLVVSYAVGSHARGWSRLAGAGVVGAGCLVVVLASPVAARDAEGMLPTLVWCGLAVAAGMLGAGWTERAVRMREIVEDLERSRDAAKRVAIARQRQVMARDLHDSVAHTLTVVCLNAGAARRVGGPATEASLATIAEASRSGMAELRNGLDALVPLEGQPRQQTLEAMAEALGVELRVDRPDDLSLDAASTSLVQRLLRETVVNAARHAPGATIVARIEHRAGQLLVEVTDDGPGHSAVDLGTGTGLASLAALLEERGGRLDHGPRREGGWRVAASLPAPLPAPPGAATHPPLRTGAAR